MRLITYNSQPLYLLDDAPDWREPFMAQASLLSEVETGLSDREGRRALGSTLRLQLRYRVLASGLQARALAAALRALRAEAVAAPLWPAAVRWADRATAEITGGLKCVLPASGGAPVLYESTEPVGILADDTLVPLVVGALNAREVVHVTDELATFAVDLLEDSPAAWAISPAAYTAPAGPRPAAYGTAPRLFPLPLHWDEPRTLLTLRLTREQVGFGRESLDYARGSTARTVEHSAWASQAEGWGAARLLRFFADHGAGTAFWTVAPQAAARLAADLPANATSAVVDDASALASGDYLALVTRGQIATGLGPISVSGSTLSFPSPGNAPAIATATTLAPLVLARFAVPELELRWSTDRLATARFRARELAPELVPPTEETLGSYLGQLAARAWLYEFSRDFAGTVLVERFTSHERDLLFAGNTYTARRISHGDLRQGIALDRDELNVTADGLDVAPLLAAASLRLEAPLMLSVFAVSVTAPGVAASATQVFSGEVVKAGLRGRVITARVSPGGTRFDRRSPRLHLQPGCNHALFGPGCGLSAAAWVHTASMQDPGSAGYPFTFLLGNLARAGGAVLTAADVFAGGWLQAGSGVSLQRLPILASTAPVGGSLVLTLSRDPAPWLGVGSALQLFPGCDQTRATCSGRFGNLANFGGFPFIPVSNPTLMSVPTGSGGKK